MTDRVPMWKDPLFLNFLSFKCAQRAAQMIVDEKNAIIDGAIRVSG